MAYKGENGMNDNGNIYQKLNYQTFERGEHKMKCPNCGSEHINVSAVNEVKSKHKKGLIYWLIIGWWWEPIAWLFFTIPKAILALFGNKSKVVSKTVTYAICQDCGHKWQIKN